MNRKQKWIAWLGIMVFVLFTLCPPWTKVVARPSTTAREIPIGSYLLWDPPQLQGDDSRWTGAKIDLGRLALEWLVVIVLTIAAIWSLRSKQNHAKEAISNPTKLEPADDEIEVKYVAPDQEAQSSPSKGASLQVDEVPASNQEAKEAISKPTKLEPADNEIEVKSVLSDQEAQSSPSKGSALQVDEVPASNQTAEITKCPACQAENPGQLKYCPDCGEFITRQPSSNQTAEITKCPACRAENPGRLKYCPDCGVRQKSEIDELTNVHAQIEGPSGIGGWLIIPAMALVLGPISGTVWFVISIFAINMAADPRLWVIALLQAAWLAMIIVVAWAFHSCRRIAVKAIIALMVASIAVRVVELLINGSMLGAGSLSDGITSIISSCIVSAVWIPYFLKSKRVKNTFVR